jgi:hypothetical protein
MKEMAAHRKMDLLDYLEELALIDRMTAAPGGNRPLTDRIASHSHRSLWCEQRKPPSRHGPGTPTDPISLARAAVERPANCRAHRPWADHHPPNYPDSGRQIMKKKKLTRLERCRAKALADKGVSKTTVDRILKSHERPLEPIVSLSHTSEETLFIIDFIVRRHFGGVVPENNFAFADSCVELFLKQIPKETWDALDPQDQHLAEHSVAIDVLNAVQRLRVVEAAETNSLVN